MTEVIVGPPTPAVLIELTPGPAPAVLVELPHGPLGPKGDTGATGATGSAGSPGPANSLAVGTVTTGSPGSAAAASITGAAPAQTLSMTIPRGDVGATGSTGGQGPAGPANALAVGTVTTGAPGSSAAVTITGTAPSQTLNVTIPRGDVGATGTAGPANSLAVGTVTTGAAGSSAAATITGTAPSQTLSLTIPRGDVGGTGPTGLTGSTGPAGSTGATGPGVPTGGSTGQYLKKNSAADYDTAWAAVVAGVTSVFGRAGAVVAAAGDYLLGQIAGATANKLVVGDGAGNLASAASLTHATSGTHLTVQAQTATDKPLVVKAAASQTAHTTEWQDSSGAVSSYMSSGGNRLNIGQYAGSGIVPGTGAALLIGTKSGEGDRAGFYLSQEDAVSGFGFFHYTGGNTYMDSYSGGSLVLRLTNSYTAVMQLSPSGSAFFAYSASAIPHIVQAAPGQTANLSQWQNSSGTTLTAVDKNGGIAPASMSDATAANGTLYYSTTQSKLCFRDAGGTVNVLY